MNLKAKQNAVVTLVKKVTGEKKEGIGAIVTGTKVFLLDVSVQPEKDDTILVPVPNGNPERLTVVTSMYNKKHKGTIAHYLIEVSR